MFSHSHTPTSQKYAHARDRAITVAHATPALFQPAFAYAHKEPHNVNRKTHSGRTGRLLSLCRAFKNDTAEMSIYLSTFVFISLDDSEIQRASAVKCYTIVLSAFQNTGKRQERT